VPTLPSACNERAVGGASHCDRSLRLLCAALVLQGGQHAGDTVPVIADRLTGDSRFLRTPFQFSKRAAGRATEFSRNGVEFLGVIGAARLECAEPSAEAVELIRRQLGNSFGDFFDFHVAQYSTAEAGLSDGKRLGAPPAYSLRRPAYSGAAVMPCMTRGE
jgi:hypothetical protein